jgi:predicted Na+-dependent transporter
MSAFLARRWFLLAIVTGALVVWLFPGALRWTAGIDPSWTGALAIFLTALGMEGRTLRQALLRPGPALCALAISFGLLPALALLLGHWQPNPDLQLGLILIASVPCTLTSAVIWTRMAAGNEATALLVVLLTNLSSCLATTIWLMSGAGLREGGIDAGNMIARLFFVLVLPVAVGQLMRLGRPFARAADRAKLPMGVGARLLTLTIMLKAAVDVRNRLGSEPGLVEGWLLLEAAALCLIAHLGALAAGYWISKALRFDRPNQIAVALAGSQKTLPVALILFDAYFTAYPLALVCLVFFHVGQLVVDTFIADALARRGPVRPATDRAAEIASDGVL